MESKLSWRFDFMFFVMFIKVEKFLKCHEFLATGFAPNQGKVDTVMCCSQTGHTMALLLLLRPFCGDLACNRWNNYSRQSFPISDCPMEILLTSF